MLTMLDKCNDKIVNFILEALGMDAKEKSKECAKVKYTLQVLVAEIEKILVLLFLFGYVGKMIEFLLALFTLVAIRMFVGGYHCKTTLGCLICTCLVFTLILTLANLIMISKWLYEVVILSVIVVIWKIPVIPSENRIRYTYAQCLKFKAKALTMLIIIIRVMEYVQSTYANVIVFTLIIQMLEAIIMFAKTKKKKENDRYEAKMERNDKEST